MILRPIETRWLVIVLLAVTATACSAEPGADETARHDARIAEFERTIEALAVQTKLPGLSAAVVLDGKLAWSRGFGFADIETRRPAQPETPYRLASLSKPLAAVVLMQGVEAGKLSLDQPMRDFVIHPWFEPGGGSWAHYPERYLERAITVRHVLTHTSQGPSPGDDYAYSGNIFADLTWVIEDWTGEPYPKVLQERVLDPAGMTRSLPGQLVPWNESVARAIATPYAVEGDSMRAASYPGFGLEPDRDVSAWGLDPDYRLPAASLAARQQRLGKAYMPLHSSQTAAGAVSTVEDLARFDLALDAGELIDDDSREQMFTPARDAQGNDLPYGLGWFVETIEGRKVVWHFGWFPPTVSALYVKVPEVRATMILLANSDGLSAGQAWTARGVRASPFARAFLAQFAPSD